MFKEYGISAPTEWIKHLDILGAIKDVIYQKDIRLLWLVSQGFLVPLVISIFWNDSLKKKNQQRNGLGGPEASGSGQHGTSRWQTEDEMDAVNYVWNTNRKLDKGGIVLGMKPYNTLSHKKLKVWLDTEDTHTLVIGATRSGKSRRLIYTTIWTLAHSGESIVVTDIKGELVSRSKKYLENKGYKVVLMDFRNPKRGNHWNPMEPVIQAVENDDESAASEAAWDIAAMISPTNEKGERIWTDGQQSVLAACILAVAMEAEKREQKNLSSVYQMLIELGVTIQTPLGPYIPLNNYFDSLPVGHIAKSAYGTAMLAPGRTRGSFFTGVAAELRLFADPNVSFLTSVQDHDMGMFGKEKTAVFLVIPDETETRHILASLYINQCYRALVSTAIQEDEEDGKLPNQVHFLLDEFGNLPKISSFDTKITVSAGRNIRYTLIIQDFGQLKKMYGDSMSTITGNCLTWIYLLTNDEYTAEIVSRKTGKYTVETEGYSATVQSKGTSQSVSHNLSGRPLLDATEVQRWPKDKAIVFQGRQLPAEYPLPDLSKWPADQQLVKGEFEYTNKIIKTSIWIPHQENNTPKEEAEEQIINSGTQDVDDVEGKEKVVLQGKDEEQENYEMEDDLRDLM